MLCEVRAKHSEARTIVRLACLIHAASVHPEPGSNSQNIGGLTQIINRLTQINFRVNPRRHPCLSACSDEVGAIGTTLKNQFLLFWAHI